MDKKNIIRLILKILYQILVVFCLLLAAVIILQRVSNSNKSIAGYRIFRVISGSMEPEYDVGEVVISKEVNPKNIKVGDDIVYLGKYGEYNGKIIMHSVVAIENDENGNLRFHAKGLHVGSVEDPQITESQIYGVVKFKSKILTVLYQLATNIYSVFAIITVLALNVFIAFRTPKNQKIQQLAEINEEVEEEEDDYEVESDDEDDDLDEDDYDEDEDEDEENDEE